MRNKRISMLFCGIAAASMVLGCADDVKKSCKMDVCKDSQTVLKCEAGVQTEENCQNGCDAGKCLPSDLEKCKSDECKDVNTLLKCNELTGVRIEEVCINGCDAGKCKENVNEKCTSDVCENDKVLLKCDVLTGVQREEKCENGCEAGRCKPAEKEKCNADVCKDVMTLYKCNVETGVQTEEACKYGCDGGKCKSSEHEKCKSDVCKDDKVLLKCDDNSGNLSEEACQYGCDGGKCKDKPKEEKLEAMDIAPSLSGKSGDALYDYLGAVLIDEGVGFAVYAKHATRLELLIFDDPESDPIERIPMKKDENSGIWTVYIKGAGVGMKYGYIAFGPNWPFDKDYEPGTLKGYISDCDAEGNRYNPNKLLIDPYARRLHGEFKFELGSPLSGSGREVCDWKAAPKSVVTKSEYVWSKSETTWRENRKKGDGFAGHGVNNMILYEVHPKGFTRNANELDESLRGTWQGIGEKAQYLAELGVTAVELMPVAEKNVDGTYWGYDTIAYFAPEMSYSTKENQKKDSGVIDEFKGMVDKLHQAGIEVILDVVYGQTGEGGFWPDKMFGSNYSYPAIEGALDNSALAHYSFRGLDNKSYYHLVKGEQAGSENRYYLNETGVGVQTRTNAKPFRRLIMDNLYYWAEEMHVDGFRIDLASVLGVLDEQVDENGDTRNFDNGYWMSNVGRTVLQDMIDDKRLSAYHTRIIAEPWSASHYVIGGFPKSSDGKSGWYEWNGRFRDSVRPFVNDDGYTLSKAEAVPPNWDEMFNLGNAFSGSSVLFGDDGRKPYHSINYITSHDGFTMYDLMSYWQKQNHCSKLNQYCCEHSSQAFCSLGSGSSDNRSRNWCQKDCNDEGCNENIDAEGRCKDNEHEALKRQMIRNVMAVMMLSQGTPMLLGGDEYMRTQYGNNDAFSNASDNEWNWFRWEEWGKSAERVRMHDYVRDLIKIRKQYQMYLAPTDYNSPIQWWFPKDVLANDGWKGKAVGMYYPGTNNAKSLYILFNMESVDKTFAVPEGEYEVLLDTQSYFEQETGRNTWFDGSRKTSQEYTVKSRSIVVMSK